MSSGQRKLSPHRIAVMELRQHNPCWTLEKIGTILGISRQRVEQHLAKAQMPTASLRPHLHCLNCSKEFWPFRKEGYISSLFCSKECKFDYQNIILVCDQCGGHFRRPAKRVVWQMNHANPLRKTARAEHCFCSKQCQGQWLGTHYGRGRARQ